MRGSVSVFDNVHQIIQSQKPAPLQTAVIGLTTPMSSEDTSTGTITPKKSQSSAVNTSNSKSGRRVDILSQSSPQELSRRLIEVLEEEKHLFEESTPFIKKKAFEELFDKNDVYKVFKCEGGDLTSGDDQLPSEDQEELEQQEQKFLEQQRTSSKNSRASSQKKSGSGSSCGAILSNKDSGSGSAEDDVARNLSKKLKLENLEEVK